MINFRPEDVGKDKLKVFLEEAKKINTNLKMTPYKSKIEGDQIAQYDQIWEELDAVICALDYRFSKNFVNNQSLWYEKPMICCAAHSLKCASQITLPKVTEGYTESSILNPQKYDPNTIWNFPYTFEHTIAWATEVFQRFLTKSAEIIGQIAQDKGAYVKQLETKELKPEVGSLKVFRVIYFLTLLKYR